ncbi:MAG: PHP domain-containing protein [Victivallales bacterium]|nr:PHP domain-containing protein [Victivallales bacterium]
MIDLHCHSTASDGTVPPEELPLLARKAGLTALALTDHDTVNGVETFLDAAKNVPDVRCIPGIELACRLESGEHCHIVGLFVDYRNDTLQRLCNQIVEWREERNRCMLEKLSELGMPLDYETLKARHGDTVVGRPHIAEEMVNRGYCKTIRDAFQQYISRGRSAYCEREVPDGPTCLQAIHDAGGLAIWAHPMTSSSRTQSKCLAIATELRDFGLDGIEVYYSEHSPTQQDTVLRIAAKLNLAVSGGSDFHGDHIPEIKLGVGYGSLRVPDSLLEELNKRAEKYRNA